MASQVSSSVGNRSLRMSDRKKDDQRRAKLKRNIMSLVVIRCMQGRVDLAQPTAEQLKDVENEVDARMDGGPVSDADVCQMAAALRRKLLQNAYRSESAPTPNTNALPKKNSLPPIENAPISPANLAVPDIASPASTLGQSSLMREDKAVFHSTKPAVVKRRENLASDQKWHQVIADDLAKYQEETRQQKTAHKKKMDECKRSLDQQVEMNSEMRRMRQDEERGFAMRELSRRTQIQQDEQARQQHKRETLVMQQEARARQLAAERNKKDSQQRRDREEEAEYRRSLQAEQQELRQREIQRRIKNTNDYKQHMEFNMTELSNKKAMQEAERMRDKSILQEHAALLEKQAKSREAILRRSEKQLPGNECYAQLHDERQQRIKAEAERVDRVVQEMEDKRRASEQARLHLANSRKQDFITTLEHQLRQKEQEKLDQRRQEEQFRRLQDEEVKNSLQLEIEAKKIKKESARCNLRHLDQQVEERHRRNMGDLQVGIAR